MGIHYEHELVREKARWLITKRKAILDWQDRQDMGLRAESAAKLQILRQRESVEGLRRLSRDEMTNRLLK